MISTVTTVTTTALGLSTVVNIGSIGAGLSLIFFLVTKELAGSNASGAFTRVAKFVNIGIVPLLMVFAITIAVKILQG